MNKFLSIFKNFPDQFIFSQYEWEYKQLIGEGGFGKIYKVRNKNENRFDAVKQLDMTLFDQPFKIQTLKTQINVMKKLQSPYIVKLLDENVGEKYSYIILELCDSDLRKQISINKGKLPQQDCCKIFSQIISGFKEIVKNQYIHRDIKPQNILIKNKIHKIADFGFTRKINKKKGETINQVCGTPLYMAPQLLFNQEYNDKCDIWSLGLMLYEMIYGFDPWPTRHPEIYKQSIKSKPVSFPYNSNIGQYTYDFLKRSLVVSQKQRISWQQVFSHPFITQKKTGPRLKFTKVDQKSQRVLKSVQESAIRKNISIFQCFKQYSKMKELNRKQFFIFLTKIDPTITTFENDTLFSIADTNKNGSVQIKQFFNLFCEVDYRPEDDIAGRRIQEIIAMAQVRNINMRQLFQMFDKDNSNTIQYHQFEGMIRKIAPAFSKEEIQQMWIRFDSDQSCKIEINEFIAQMTRNVPNEGSRLDPNFQRAKRNLKCLKDFLNYNKISVQKSISKMDHNKDKTISLQEFGNTIQQLGYQISKDQIMQMHNFLSKNNKQNCNISIECLMQWIA